MKELQKLKELARDIADACLFEDIKIEAPGGLSFKCGRARLDIAADENLLVRLDIFGEERNDDYVQD